MKYRRMSLEMLIEYEITRMSNFSLWMLRFGGRDKSFLKRCKKRHAHYLESIQYANEQEALTEVKHIISQ